MMDALKLCQLTCSRLCHDLITPVGALSSGLEIIADSPDQIDAELLDLTEQSAKNASARLIYYRAAFGFAGSALFGTPEKVYQLVNGFLKNAQIKLEWDLGPLNGYESLFSNYGRFILNLTGVMAETAPLGGRFTILAKPALKRRAFDFEFNLTGDIFEIKPETRKCLKGLASEDEITPHVVQAYLTYLYQQNLDLDLLIKSSNKKEFLISAKPIEKEVEFSGQLF